MSFKKMRLIPEYMYEKLNQDNLPRRLDFGDETNKLLFELTEDISPILKDKDKSIEERVRIMYQHLIRKLSADEDDLKKKKEEQSEAKDKKKEDKAKANEDRHDRSRDVSVAQRNHVMGVKTQASY